MTKARLGGRAIEISLMGEAPDVVVEASPKIETLSTKTRFGGDGEALPIRCHRQTGQP